MEDYYGIKSRRAREYIRSLPFKKKIPMKAMFPKTSDLALDLLEKLLAFNPVKRITVEEALKHPYLEPYHDPEDEPTAEAIPEEFFDFDKNKDTLTKEELKRMSSMLSILARTDVHRINIRRNHEIRKIFAYRFDHGLVISLDTELMISIFINPICRLGTTELASTCIRHGLQGPGALSFSLQPSIDARYCANPAV